MSPTPSLVRSPVVAPLLVVAFAACPAPPPLASLDDTSPRAVVDDGPREVRPPGSDVADAGAWDAGAPTDDAGALEGDDAGVEDVDDAGVEDVDAGVVTDAGGEDEGESAEGEGEGVAPGEGEGEAAGGEGESAEDEGEGAEGEGEGNVDDDIGGFDDPLEVALPFTLDLDLGPGDEDCVTFTNGIAGTFSVGTSDGSGGCPGDTLARIYDAEGNLRSQNDDGGNTPPCARLDFTNDRGTYTVCISGKGGAAIDDVELAGTAVRPRVFISEIAAPELDGARYVELYNTTLHPITLVDMAIAVYEDGLAPPRIVDIPDHVVIPAATPGTIGTCQLTLVKDAAAFASAFPDATYDVVLPDLELDGTDAVALVYGDTIVDLYGVVGVDGAGQPWSFVGGEVTRQVLVTTPQTEMDPAEWIVGADFTPDWHVHP